MKAGELAPLPSRAPSAGAGRRVALLVCALPLLAAVTLRGPCGPIPGAVLEGTQAEPAADWTFVGNSRACAIEMRPQSPHSIRASCFSRERALYVRALFAPRKRWPTYVAENPDVRVRIDGKIYNLRAVRVTSAVDRARILSPDDPTDTPSESTWLYRLESR